MERLQEELNELDWTLAWICAKERNLFVKEQIKVDFREGLRETISQHHEDFDDGMDEERETRVEELAQHLKVFCISSSDFMRNKDLVSGSPAVRVLTPLPIASCFVFHNVMFNFSI